VSLVSDLDEVANVRTEWLSTVLFGAILNEMSNDEHSIRDEDNRSSGEPWNAVTQRPHHSPRIR
jgi:hypothetical protein